MNTIQMVTICIGLLALLYVFYKRAWGSSLTYVLTFILFLFGVVRLVELVNQPDRYDQSHLQSSGGNYQNPFLRGNPYD